MTEQEFKEMEELVHELRFQSWLPRAKKELALVKRCESAEARIEELEKALRELLPFHEGWHTGKHVAGQWLEAQAKAKAALKEPR